jgi:Fic family protein
MGALISKESAAARQPELGIRPGHEPVPRQPSPRKQLYKAPSAILDFGRLPNSNRPYTSSLKSSGRHVNPHLISAPLLRREAISSSRIEGTIATPEQLVLLEVEADRYYQRLQSARSSALLLKLVDQLFIRPSMSIGTAGALLQVTPASAAANLRKLVEAEILVEVTGRRRDQRFLAPEIIRASHGE